MSSDSPAHNSNAPMFRVYLRYPNQIVSDKTTTSSSDVAKFAFRELLQRTDLIGQEVGAVLTGNGKQIAYHRFDRTEGMENYWKADDEIPLMNFGNRA